MTLLVPATPPKREALFAAQLIRERYNLVQRKRGDKTDKARRESTQDSIAADLGLTKPQVNMLLKRGAGFGDKFERAVATKFFGGSVDDFRRAAQSWEPPVEPPVLLSSSFVERVAALPGLAAFLAGEGAKYLTGVVETVLAEYGAATTIRSQEDGAPLGGWERYFADTLAGRARARADAAADPFIAAEVKALPPRAKRRMK